MPLLSPISYNFLFATCKGCANNFLWVLLGKGHVDLYKAPTIEESKMLRGEGDEIKFIDLRFERWYVVGFGKGRRKQNGSMNYTFLEWIDDWWVRVREVGSETVKGCDWVELLVVLTRLRGRWKILLIPEVRCYSGNHTGDWIKTVKSLISLGLFHDANGGFKKILQKGNLSL